MDWRPPPLMMRAWELELRRELELTHRSSEGPLGFHLRAGAKEGQHKQCVCLSLSFSERREESGRLGSLLQRVSAAVQQQYDMMLAVV